MMPEDQLIFTVEDIISKPIQDRTASLQMIAHTIRRGRNYRRVRLYDVDHVAGIIKNIVLSGLGAPAHPEFPITNVGDVTADDQVYGPRHSITGISASATGSFYPLVVAVLYQLAPLSSIF